MRIYLDASPLIYLVEQRAPYAAQVLGRISTPGIMLVSSDLALMEALVQPLRQHNQRLVQDFNNFFAVQVAERIAFSEAVFRKAADIRAHYNFRTPDALHLAAASTAVCDLFLTNDAALKSFPGITVDVVS
jgi:predicted nucleic acid-binding protein